MASSKPRRASIHVFSLRALGEGFCASAAEISLPIGISTADGGQSRGIGSERRPVY